LYISFAILYFCLSNKIYFIFSKKITIDPSKKYKTQILLLHLIEKLDKTTDWDPKVPCIVNAISFAEFDLAQRLLENPNYAQEAEIYLSDIPFFRPRSELENKLYFTYKNIFRLIKKNYDQKINFIPDLISKTIQDLFSLNLRSGNLSKIKYFMYSKNILSYLIENPLAEAIVNKKFKIARFLLQFLEGEVIVEAKEKLEKCCEEDVKIINDLINDLIDLKYKELIKLLWKDSKSLDEIKISFEIMLDGFNEERKRKLMKKIEEAFHNLQAFGQ
jgi:hypothetical protein